MSSPTQPRQSAVVRRFLERYFADDERGAVGSLEDYQEVFPEDREGVAEAWKVLMDAEPSDSPVPPSLPDGLALTSGDHIGPYRLDRLLGEGGQGVVYLATDTRLSRPVAIKLLTRVLLRPSDTRVQRFRREAELAARLDHPGLCAVYEADLEAGVPYIVMPYVEGPTLAKVLTEGGALDVDRAIRTIEQVARALHVAHSANVIHRDIKPANIVLAASDRPVLMDFGIARDLDSEGPALTLTGELVGTIPYMAPEQVLGEAVGPRTDIYALGVTLYEAVTGRLPHDEPTQRALLNSIAHDTPPDPRRFSDDVSRDLGVVIGVALEKEPSRRFRNAEQLADELLRIQKNEPIHSRPAGIALRLRRSFQRDPRLASTILAAFVILLAGLLITLGLLDRVDRERRTKERALDEIELLADMTRLDELRDGVDSFHPPRPEQVPEMDSWLARADALTDRLPLHEAILDDLRTRGTPDPEGEAWKFADAEDAWRYRLHVELVDGLRALQGDDEYGPTRVHVAGLLDFAGNLQQRSIDDHLDAWESARERVAADPRFDGFQLAPQLGLVPLGPDVESGLEEFADLSTGRPPFRDKETSQLVLEDDVGVVLVLLPGGEETHGAIKPTPSMPLGSPNVDPDAKHDEGPLVEVQLDPFLLSKYEVTQGQWQAITGDRPSYFAQGEQYEKAGGVIPLHPVDSVSWNMANETLRKIGLILPTSAQWEHGARAGTTTPWAWGSDLECVFDRANIGDLALHEITKTAFQAEVYGYNDGWAGPAPIGTYLPNGFGLHDTAGNMQEWVRDIDHYLDEPARPGDGLRVEGDELEVLVRGGSFRLYVHETRSAARHRFAPETVNTNFGVRPARTLILP